MFRDRLGEDEWSRERRFDLEEEERERDFQYSEIDGFNERGGFHFTTTTACGTSASLLPTTPIFFNAFL